VNWTRPLDAPISSGMRREWQNQLKPRHNGLEGRRRAAPQAGMRVVSAGLAQVEIAAGYDFTVGPATDSAGARGQRGRCWWC